MSGWTNPIFGPPQEAYADFKGEQTSLTDYCSQAVPWYCAAGWIPLIGAPIALSTECREAYDLERACNAGGFNRNILPGSGAGPASTIATQPGVNYNDAGVLATIAEQQRKNDAAEWQRTIDANRRLLSGAPADDADKKPEMNFMVLLALVVVIGGLLLAQR